ncbi:MAG: GGDEF domain-containing protein [Acidimicrobiales bacterium]|nr:GGDEF domain-containing protein [Acidimicrobiales bacterium]
MNSSVRWLPRLQARTLAGMWIVGSLLILGVGELPGQNHLGAQTVVIVLCSAVAVPLILSKDWRDLPDWVYHALIVTASVALGAGAISWRNSSSALGAGLMFVWLSLYVFFFFSDVAALFHLATFEAVIAGAIFYAGSGNDGAEATLLASTVAGSGLVTGYLTHTLKNVARSDPLTGLGNRAALEEVLTREIARSERNEVPLCVAVLDLDDFKYINDLSGHAAGDSLLVGVVEDWQRALRATDVIARLGGDEFALVLPDLSRQDAPTVLERARQRCRHSCSLGVAIWHPGDTCTSLLNRADAFLYAAKQEGKSRVSVEGARVLQNRTPAPFPVSENPSLTVPSSFWQAN